MQELEETTIPAEEVEPSREQKRHPLFKHPDREILEALLKRGKSAEWISIYLEEQYPTEEFDKENNPIPHPEAKINEKQLLAPELIEEYRCEYLPTFAPGFDVLTPELEDAIGRRFPAPDGPQFEVAIADASMRAAEINLARGLTADEELDMLQPTTLQAQAQLLDAASLSVDIKSRVGVPGYEPPPERVEIDQTTRSMSVEFTGKIDPATGRPMANEPDKLKVLRDLMSMPEERAEKVLETAKSMNGNGAKGANGGAGDDGVVDSVATEIPEDEDLDGGPGITSEDRRRKGSDPA